MSPDTAAISLEIDGKVAYAICNAPDDAEGILNAILEVFAAITENNLNIHTLIGVEKLKDWSAKGAGLFTALAVLACAEEIKILRGTP